MWITKKTDYATRAVLALALQYETGGHLSVQEISDRVEVPPRFLGQIMVQLRGAGIVRSERGPAGGYRLNRSPEEISMERIVRVFQGPLAPIPCATRANPEPCSMDEGCALRAVWAQVRDQTIETLKHTDFATLASRSAGRWADLLSPGPTNPEAPPASSRRRGR